MSSEARFIRVLIAGALVLGACADFSRGEPSPKADAGAPTEGGSEGGSEGGGEGGATLSFATDVYPLLTAACANCHATGKEAGDTQLLFTDAAATDYAPVMMFVDTSAPAARRDTSPRDAS